MAAGGVPIPLQLRRVVSSRLTAQPGKHADTVGASSGACAPRARWAQTSWPARTHCWLSSALSCCSPSFSPDPPPTILIPTVRVLTPGSAPGVPYLSQGAWGVQDPDILPVGSLWSLCVMLVTCGPAVKNLPEGSWMAGGHLLCDQPGQRTYMLAWQPFTSCPEPPNQKLHFNKILGSLPASKGQGQFTGPHVPCFPPLTLTG